jgi:hypothetical protein
VILPGGRWRRACRAISLFCAGSELPILDVEATSIQNGFPELARISPSEPGQLSLFVGTAGFRGQILCYTRRAARCGEIAMVDGISYFIKELHRAEHLRDEQVLLSQLV